MNHSADEPMPVMFITDSQLAETARLLDSFAIAQPSEGIVYWFGVESTHFSVVTTIIVPDADTSGGDIYTTELANAQVLMRIVGTPLKLLGQAHTHPGRYVSHSPTDDAETFGRFPGAISVVVPWFGRYGIRLAECGVHRFINGQFHRVQKIDDHIRVLPGMHDLREVKS